jgi:hypothetical protein
MSIYKGTLLFSFAGHPVCGFSESFGFEAPDDQGAKDAVASWPAQRKNFLANQWAIVGYRISKVQSYRFVPDSPADPVCKFKFTPVTVQACPVAVAGALGDADSPYTCVLYDFFREDQKHPRAYLARGIPDTWWASAHIGDPIPDQAAVDAWFAFMRVFWSFGALDRGPNNTGPPKIPPTTCTLAIHHYKSMCLRRIASRRIGRPFDLLVGRRSAK